MAKKRGPGTFAKVGTIVKTAAKKVRTAADEYVVQPIEKALSRKKKPARKKATAKKTAAKKPKKATRRKAAAKR